MEIGNPVLAFLYGVISDEIRARTSLFGVVPKIHFWNTKSTQEWELNHDKKKGKMMDNMTDRTETDTLRIHRSLWERCMAVQPHSEERSYICAHAGSTIDNFLHRNPAISIVYYRISLSIGTF